VSTDSTTLEQLKPSQIWPHPKNRRRDVGDVTDMAASVKEHGLLEPVLVAPIDRDAWPRAPKAVTHILLAGHRRHAAAKVAKAATIPSLVRHDLTALADQVEVMMIENGHREDLTPIEEAEGYQLLLDLTGLTQAKVAERVAMPARRVRDRLKLVKLPDGIQTRVHEGQIHVTEALEAAAFVSDPEVMADLDKAAGTPNFALALQRAKAERKADQDYRSTLKQIRDAGMVEVDQKPTPSSTLAADEGSSRLDYCVGYVAGVGHYPSYASAQAKWEFVKKGHQDCPGHVVWVNPKASTREVEFGCTQPNVHRSTGSPRPVNDTPLPTTPEEKAARDAEDERRAKEQREREALRRQLDAAAEVRREHVGQILHAGGNEDLAKRLLIRHLLPAEQGSGYNEYPLPTGRFYTAGWAVIAKVLRLAPEVEEPEKRRDLLERALTKLSLPAVAILAALPHIHMTDHELTQLYVQFDPDALDPAVEWIHTLTDDLAYEWSDFERHQFGLDNKGHLPSQDHDETEDGAA